VAAAESSGGRPCSGLQTAPPPPELSAEPEGLGPATAIFAGTRAGHGSADALVSILHESSAIDQVYEFQLDRKRLTEMPSHTSPARELQ